VAANAEALDVVEVVDFTADANYQLHPAGQGNGIARNH